jgi:dTDP-4-amino-4,6-dideoxygalactose transaminase
VLPEHSHISTISKHYEKKYGKKLYWIFDFAHAFGSVDVPNDKEFPTFNHDHFVCYSFGPIKTLTTVNGGCLVCPPEFYDLAEKLLWYGISRRDNCSFRAWSDIKDVGSKWNMDDVQAATGLANLEIVDAAIRKSRDNVLYYLDNIKNDVVVLPDRRVISGSSCWLFTILVDDREKFQRYMAKHNVEVNGVHRPNHTLSCVEGYRTELPVLDSLYNKYVSIPCGSHLTLEQIQYITDKVNAYI